MLLNLDTLKQLSCRLGSSILLDIDGKSAFFSLSKWRRLACLVVSVKITWASVETIKEEEAGSGWNAVAVVLYVSVMLSW